MVDLHPEDRADRLGLSSPMNLQDSNGLGRGTEMRLVIQIEPVEAREKMGR